ncbi:GMC family oxidoreductase, partial [Paraburkholderia oxyphila]|uniref:GMC family oxidoreductase n=1 Tax=Paraburkholderia oxyphila TaxID=614212 RepID=UPI0004881E6D
PHPRPSGLADALLDAGRQTGLRVKPDQNQPEHSGIGYLQANIDRRGRRVSAARGFLDPIRGRRKNLTIVTDTQVNRVSFAGRRAAGVCCTQGGKTLDFRVHRGGEVILSAGAIQSPKLLQLSGIGPAGQLQSLGIEVVQDSQGVGQNLREHQLIFLQFRLKHQADSYNNQFGGLSLAKNILKYLVFGSGPMAYASSEAAAFVEILPGARRPEAQLMFSPYSLDLDTPGHMSFEKEPGMQLYPYLLRPTSQGSVMIQSADPNALPQIDPNYLATDYDRNVSIGMVRYVRRLVGQEALRPYVVSETKWTRDAQTDDEILDAFRKYGQSGYHASGTCRMGSDAAAVVDERLRVRGVSGLRVMDCSVCPEIIAGNTNAPMMAMAWRASDLMLEDWKQRLRG